MQEKESIISVRHEWTNLSLGSLFGNCMPNSDPWDRFVHPYLTLMSDSYILAYLMKKYKKILGFGQGQKYCSDPDVLSLLF